MLYKVDLELIFLLDFLVNLNFLKKKFTVRTINLFICFILLPAVQIGSADQPSVSVTTDGAWWRDSNFRPAPQFQSPRPAAVLAPHMRCGWQSVEVRGDTGTDNYPPS